MAVKLTDVTRYLKGHKCAQETRVCMARLAKTPNVWTLGCIRKVRRLAQRMGIPEGQVIVEVLRAMNTEKDEMGQLGAIYNWLVKRLPSSFEDIGDAREIFRARQCLTHRQKAITYCGDSVFAMSEWVERWNDRVKRKHD